MNNTRVLLLIIVVIGIVGGFFLSQKNTISPAIKNAQKTSQQPEDTNPLSIALQREKSYPGSDLIIEETLPDGSNYHQYIASYKSEGLKIYGLLTLPIGTKPKEGWPTIIFNHGYIPPTEYRTTERYVAYVAAFARNGYLVFKPDYRGHGSSEGKAEGAYYSPAYTTDVMNALATIKKYKDTDAKKIGMWGHSLGGYITLRVLVIDPNAIKAAVIWAGVVGSYDDLLNKWHNRNTSQPNPTQTALRNNSRQQLQKQYGTPQSNPTFWQSIDATYFLSDISARIQIHHGESDEEVPVAFSVSLKEKLEKAGKSGELYTYPGNDHNISQSFDLAMQRSVSFFDKYVKEVKDK